MVERVRFEGCSEDQIRWGGNDDPNSVLTVGEVYEVEHREVHSWHTKLKLVGIDGMFNSVCFDEVEEG